MGSTRDIEEWLRAQSDLCKQNGRSNYGDPVWAAVRNGETEHVQQLVHCQKNSKKKGNRHSGYITSERKRPLDRGRPDYSSRYKSSHSKKSSREVHSKSYHSYHRSNMETGSRRTYESPEVNQSDQYYQNPTGSRSKVDRSRSTELVQLGHIRPNIQTRDRIKGPPGSKINRSSDYERGKSGTIEKATFIESPPKIETDQKSYSVRARTPSEVSESDQSSELSEHNDSISGTDSEDRDQFIMETRRAIEEKIKISRLAESKKIGVKGDHLTDNSVSAPEDHFSQNGESGLVRGGTQPWDKMSGDGPPAASVSEHVLTQKPKKQKKKNGMADVQEMLRNTIVQNGNEIQIKHLLEVFNRDFMVRLLSRKPISIEKFLQVLKGYPDEFEIENDIVFLVETCSTLYSTDRSDQIENDDYDQCGQLTDSTEDTQYSTINYTTQGTQTNPTFSISPQDLQNQLSELAESVRRLELEIPNMERNILDGVRDIIKKRKSRTAL